MIDRKPLVSILTPCYNGGKYIERYAESLLNQDYSNCQLIFMDDGSTDNSAELIKAYTNRFLDKGFSFEYYYHQNVGAGGTIAEGIKYVKGDYLIWPDVDDMISEDSISKKVEYLENKTDYGVVRSLYKKVSDSNITHTIAIGPTFSFDKTKEWLFEDYLLSRNVWLQPGCFMIRTKALDSANPERYIYPTRRGQNWQMLLPVLYKYKCGLIEEPLYIYVLHDNSLSDTRHDNYDVEIKRINMYEELILATISHMNIPDYNDLANRVKAMYLGERINIAFKYYKSKEARMFYFQLNSIGKPTFKQKIKVLLAGNSLIHTILGFRKVYSLYKH